MFKYNLFENVIEVKYKCARIFDFKISNKKI